MTDKEFWEKCGFQFRIDGTVGRPDGLIFTPEGFERWSNSITLDDLIRWAVPSLKGLYDIRLQNVIEGWAAVISKGNSVWEAKDPDPAQALKKAIEEAWL